MIMAYSDSEPLKHSTLNPFPFFILHTLLSHMLTTQVLHSSIKFMSCLSVQKQVESSAASAVHIAIMFIVHCVI